MGTLARPEKAAWSAETGGDRLAKTLVRYATLGLMLVLVLAFALASPLFLSWETLQNVITQASISAIVASGLTLVLATGNWDLSFGSTAGLAGMMTCWVIGRTINAQGDGNMALGIAVGLAFGLACGALNGLFVAHFGFNDMLTTLATSAVFLGLTWIPSDGYKIYKGLGPSYSFLYSGRLGPVPFVVIPTLIFAGFAYLLLHRSRTGREIYATGGNATAAYHSGIRIPHVRFLVFALMGVFAAVGGILSTSDQVGAWVLLGQPFMLRDFCAAFLGWSLAGRPSVLGAVIGAYFLITMRIGLILVGIPYHYSDVIIGLILVIAIAIGSERQKRM
jgi:ribose transport system permease protein